jgi:Tol biopolymer transport system component
MHRTETLGPPVAAARAGALALTLALAGLAAACGSDDPSSASAPTSPAGSGTLLFSRFDESSHTFLSTHTISPDGAGERTVPMPGPEGGGRWSHAGTEIAVMTIRDDGRVGTAIIAPDGEVRRVLDIPDPTLNLVCTVWSPDDRSLACEGWDDEDPARTGIYLVRSADGSGLSRVTTPPADRSDLPGDISPDGSSLLFRRAAGEEDGTLHEVALDGGTPAPLGDAAVEDPGRYSPDGTRILTSGHGRLLVLNTAGEVVTEIAERGAYLFGAVWSPDGSRIAYSRATSGPFADVYTSLPDGSDRTQVTDTPANEIRVEWGAGPAT